MDGLCRTLENERRATSGTGACNLLRASAVERSGGQAGFSPPPSSAVTLARNIDAVRISKFTSFLPCLCQGREVRRMASACLRWLPSALCITYKYPPHIRTHGLCHLFSVLPHFALHYLKHQTRACCGRQTGLYSYRATGVSCVYAGSMGAIWLCQAREDGGRRHAPPFLV